MPIYRFVVRFSHFDPRSSGILSDARALGFQNLQRVECQDLYFIEGQLSQEELQQLALNLLTDPVTQTSSWMEHPAPLTPPKPCLLYTSDAADERSSVDLGGRRIIKNKNPRNNHRRRIQRTQDKHKQTKNTIA